MDLLAWSCASCLRVCLGSSRSVSSTVGGGLFGLTRVVVELLGSVLFSWPVFCGFVGWCYDGLCGVG